MRKLRNWVIALAVAALIMSILATQTGLPEPLPEESLSATRLAAGALETRSVERDYVDTSRPSQAYGDFEGSSSRKLETTIWYPSADEAEPFPLIIYSHGFMSTRDEAAYLGEHLAAFGYVVVAADYPLSSRDVAPDRPYALDVVNQPGDISFLIDQVLEESKEQGNELFGLVDSGRIGAVGLSLGGLTSTLVAFHPDLADPRIDAAMSIAGPSGLFDQRFFQHRNVPFLMLAGTFDAIVPYPQNALPMTEKLPGSQLVTIEKGTHVGFSDIAKWFRWMKNPDSLACSLVMRGLEDDIDQDWTPIFGTAEMGIKMGYRDPICEQEAFPQSMNPMRQMMITAVVVEAFFSRELSDDQKGRQRAAAFLAGQLAKELPEVTVR